MKRLSTHAQVPVMGNECSAEEHSNYTGESMMIAASGQEFQEANDWKQTTLGELASAADCLIQTGPFGSQLHKYEYQDHGVGVVNPTHLSKNRIAHNSVPCVSVDTAHRLERHRLAVGDILFGRRGEIGRHGLVTEAEDRWLCGTGCFLIRIRREDVDNHFLSLFLTTEDTVDWLNRHAAGVVMPNLSNSVLHRVPVFLPPISEQRKIAVVLGVVQRAIEQQERLMAVTTEVKRALLNQLFTQGLRGERQKQTEIGPVPRSWEITKFDKTVDIKNGQIDPTAAPFNAMIHVGPENIQSNTGHLTQLRSNAELRITSGNYHFTPDDVLYSKIRPYLNKAALPDFEGTCSADMYPLRSKAGQFLRTYLFQMLLSETFKKQAVSFQDRTGIPKINRAQLGSIWLPRPSIAEQQAIADCLATCDNKVEVHIRKHAAVTALSRTLLHQLMKALVRVTDLEICTDDLARDSVI